VVKTVARHRLAEGNDKPTPRSEASLEHPSVSVARVRAAIVLTPFRPLMLGNQQALPKDANSRYLVVGKLRLR
jgi:hypothetical protein